MEFRLLNDAVAQGNVDALFNSDVYSQVGVENNISRYLEKDPVPKYLRNPFFNGGGIVSAKLPAEKANKIRQALEKAIAFIKENPVEARKTMLKYLPFGQGVVLNAPIDEFYPLSELNGTDAQAVADLLYENKAITARVNASQMFYR